MLTTAPPCETGAPRAAVLGAPVAHSLSPVMHRAAYRELGLDWEYERHECRADRLPGLLAGLGPQWRGLSLTMPLKEIALELAERVDDVARDVGAVNTLVRTATGWSGHNTDVAGVTAALDRAGVASATRVLVLGSGATTRSVLGAVAGIGARQVTFAVRAAVREETVRFAAGLGLVADAVPLTEVGAVLDAAGGPSAVDLVVDTLPGSAADPVAAALAGRPELPALFEVIYEGWPTRLAQTFAGAGAPVASGLDMLAFQGAAQVRLMTGLDLPAPRWVQIAEVMLAAAQAELAGR